MNEDEIDLSSSSSSSSDSSLFCLKNDLNCDCNKKHSLNDSNLEKKDSENDSADDFSCTDQVKPRFSSEIELNDLPPIEKLSIKVDDFFLVHMGSVSSIVNQLVIVHSFKNIPALDCNSVLFLRDCEPLGRIYDVFGRVKEAFYSVRFNTPKDIVDRNVAIGDPVYYYPTSESYTSYVLMNSVENIKGSDASWIDDNEPPEEELDFSNDEEERLHLLKKRSKRKISSPGICVESEN